MNWIPLLFALCAILAHAEEKQEDYVKLLTDATIDEAIKKNDIIMIKFFLPECPHCIALKPEYIKASKMIKDQEKPYVLAEINSIQNTVASEKYEIQGYPTLLLFVNGSPTEYEGERNAEDIVAYMEKMVGPASGELNLEKLKTVKEKTGLRVFYELF